MSNSRLITHKLKNTSTQPSLVSRLLAKRMVFAFMQQLKVGQLTLRERGQEYRFGGSSEIVAEIEVNDERFYSKLVSGGSIGAGEAYIEGWWTSTDVTSVIELFSANLAVIDRIEALVEWVKRPIRPLLSWLKRNTKSKAKANIEAHYDLGNELYSRFLDPTMLYSAAIYPSENASLHEASLNKLKVICESLDLCASDHLLEIGTGWGGLAVYAAEKYGCKVTTTTLSEEQFAYTEALVKEKGLGDKITLLKKDYRDLTGSYDKIVSIEMIEAVGHEYFQSYFQICDSLLKEKGKLLIQSILIDHARYDQYRRGEDFIQKYIFPGGALPSREIIESITQQHTRLKSTSFFSFGYDYARTLADWRARFNNEWSEIRQFGYDERFRRMWNFYFHYCEGGFWQDRIDVAHFVFRKE
ncbi:cyclopropane-fatty-acyl-phospholipid synthase family protein [Pleionea litopenaei]|uniref:Cyclopropane-fatty-acyl-phospholipid synthase family protein n=1 Tax=Pleionea litopenaei TaxID=3070815 RepID=A0AA51RVF3_9GAMM|nr:cyclopropane-fatty-acyl-phospholipid synthase family protein [Pleionea sp. HL-JVS1]WMS88235.1 cyclopropane-fatty-acyl-phospholipid synthase family protein [Pleionea sp. HL-JVS1]